MKRLAVLLCGMLLLASCDDIEDAHTLPKEFLIDGFTDVSELTYDELENILNKSNDSYLREEIRQSGGLIIKAAVKAGNGEAYNNVNLWGAINESDLPKDHSYMWNANTLPCITYNTDTPLFYQINQLMAESVNNSTYYYKLELNTWGSEFPGFVDNCLEGDYYSQYAFSNVKTYTRPEVPFIFNCSIMEDTEQIIGRFYVKSKYQITQGGICYSLTKELPTVEDSVEYNHYNGDWNEYEMNMNVWAQTEKAGSYYVRAFATSAGGTAYSPVWKVTIY